MLVWLLLQAGEAGGKTHRTAEEEEGDGTAMDVTMAEPGGKEAKEVVGCVTHHPRFSPNWLS